MAPVQDSDAVYRDHYGSRRDGSPETQAAWELYNREKEERARVFESGKSTPITRPESSADDAAWQIYYLDQAARTGRWAGPGGSTPRPAATATATATTSDDSAWEAYYRTRGTASQAEQQFNFSSSSTAKATTTPPKAAVEEGEIVRKPIPRHPRNFHNIHRNLRPAPIFRGVRYYIHKTVPQAIFGWLRSLLIWNGAEMGCYRPDTADIIILHFPTPQPNKKVDDLQPERTLDECRSRNIWETSDLYALLARRTNAKRDVPKRRCVVQSEWVEQSVKAGKRLEGDNKGGWEIKIINDRLGGLDDVATDLPASIAPAPVGGAPQVSFDFDDGTIPGGPAPGTEMWEYHRPDAGPAGLDTTFDRNNMYGLPLPPAQEPLPSSSNIQGVFCRDQVLPLSFYVIGAEKHRSTVQTITRLGGGVLAPMKQATFIIAPVRGKRVVDGDDDAEVVRVVSEMDFGRAVISVEWIEKCIDDDTLASIDTYRVTSAEDDDVVEVISRPNSRTSISRRVATPPPERARERERERKPVINSPFQPIPEPEPLGRHREKQRRAPPAAAAPSSSPFVPIEPPVPMLPTPRSSPIPILEPTPTTSRPSSSRLASPDILAVPADGRAK